MSDATIFRIRTLLDRLQLDRIRTQLQPHFVFGDESSVAVANTIDLTRARLRQLYADQQSFDVSTVHPFAITTVRIPFREMAARESDVTDREREQHDPSLDCR